MTQESVDHAMQSPNLLLVVEVGSTAHGTGIPGGEDFDMIGVEIETLEQVFSTNRDALRSAMHRTQPEGSRSGPGDTDLTIHPLRKFLALAASGNPSILMCLWSPVIKITPLGEELRSIAPAFIGRHVIPKYRGYMYSQTSRLLGIGGGKHGKRGGGQRPELIEQHGYDTKYAMHAARLGFQCKELLTTGKLTFPIQDWPGDWLRNVRLGLMPFDEWWTVIQNVDADCEALLDDESYRAGPDTEAIIKWSYQTHLWHWRTQ
jgi:hypothetical protein